jgi:hypothetical protein
MKNRTRKREKPHRDIRSDLKERLKFATGKRAELDADIELLTKLLDREERRYGLLKPRSKESAQKPLAEFLLDKMRIGGMTKDDMRIYAADAGYFEDGQSPARVIHATVLNLTKANKIYDIGGGLFESGPD